MKPSNNFFDKIKSFQQSAADFLNMHINKYPARKLKIGFIISGLTIGIFCFLLIIGIVCSDDSGHALQVDSLSMPRKIHQFSMDSLKSLPSKVIDSLEALIKHLYKDQLNSRY